MKKALVGVLVLASLLACDHEAMKPEGEFAHGVFIVNEGNFGDADGSVSYFNPATGEVTDDLYGKENNGLALGDVVQDLHLDGDKAYIVVNNSNKVVVVQASSFASTATIEGLSLPRYMTTHDGFGYVSEWVNFSDPGAVAVVDLKTNAVTKTITTDYGAEGILFVSGKLFVSNSFTNTISIVDPTTEAVTGTVTVASGPGGLVLDDHDELWVACGGGYDQDYAPLNDGALVEIDPANGTVVRSIELGTNITARIAIDKTGEALYYFVGNAVYRAATSAATAPSDPLFTVDGAVQLYGLGVDPSSGVIYVADARGFQGSGTVYRYGTNGQPIDSFDVGRGPNGFVFMP